MHRTTVMLPSDLKQQALSYAQESGMSLGEVIREALATWLDRTNKPSATDPFFSNHAVYDGPSPPDLSAHHDDYLYGESHAVR